MRLRQDSAAGDSVSGTLNFRRRSSVSSLRLIDSPTIMPRKRVFSTDAAKRSDRPSLYIGEDAISFRVDGGVCASDSNSNCVRATMRESHRVEDLLVPSLEYD